MMDKTTGMPGPDWSGHSMMKGLGEAKKLLKEAISLHARHMDGTEPTSDKSQMKLQKLLKEALGKLPKE